jgi:hypothetical protein
MSSTAGVCDSGPHYVIIVHARRGTCCATNNVLHPGTEHLRLHGLMGQGRKHDAYPGMT